MNPSTRRARLVVDELVRGGVIDAVLCPGSRNAPLAFALHAADAAGRLRLHVRIDERTAGFLALGLALASGRPVPVCTTSGTAVANLHPAVLEASLAGVPLLALTADRPPELVGTGASQTVDQVGIFGGAIRLAPVIDGSDAQVRAAVGRALAAAVGTGAAPGPVHINLPFAEPLVPDGGAEAVDGRSDGAPWTAVPPVRRSAAALPLDPTADTLVIAGPGAPTLTGIGVPVVAEPSSAAWPAAAPAGPWLVGTPALRPAQVVVAGRPTLHRSVSQLLADPGVALFALDSALPWTDVSGLVRAVGSLPPLRPAPAWTRRWSVAGAAASAALDAGLGAAPDPAWAQRWSGASTGPDAAPAGLRLARALVAALPGGAQLIVGSSNPIRDVALAALPRGDVTIRSNRGVAGIDGTVSTSVGAALAHPGPSYALMGDLTFLHDTTGLLIGPGEPRPDLAIVVLNDGGGGIFGLLEQGADEHASAFERIFGTPQDVDLAALCAAAGVPHARASADGIGAALDGKGLRVVEVTADRAGLRTGHAALRAAVASAVSG